MMKVIMVCTKQSPKSMHDKFYCSKLHLYLLIVLMSFESYIEHREY